MLVLCLHDTKLELVEDFVIRTLWGSDLCGFSYSTYVGASGDILTLWEVDV